MQKTDTQAKSKMKSYAEATRNAATSPIKLGDTVLVANDAKGKLTPPFDPRPLIIVEKKGSMLTAADHDKTVTRNNSPFKLLPEQGTSVEGVPTSQESLALGIKKSFLIPSIKLKYLGYFSESDKQAFTLPPEKVLKFAALRDSILGKKTVSLETLQKFSGKTTSFSLLVPGAKLYTNAV